MDRPPDQRLRILVADDGRHASDHAGVAAHLLFGRDAEYLSITVDEDEHPDVAVAIRDAAAEQHADVIVVGRQDRSWFGHLVHSSTSRDVVAAADRPVLVVRRPRPLPPPGHHLSVMVATDGSPGALHAARVARWIFGPEVRYEVVHVAAAPAGSEERAPLTGVHDAAAEFAGQLAEEVAHTTTVVTAEALGAPPATLTVLHGDAAARLSWWARDTRADVIVVGSTGATGLLDVFLGSVAQRVVEHADGPVLVVPPEA